MKTFDLRARGRSDHIDSELSKFLKCFLIVCIEFLYGFQLLLPLSHNWHQELM